MIKPILLSAVALCGFLFAPSASAQVEFSVNVAPPPLRVEIVPTAPYGSAVWAPGHWQRAQGQWVWTAGAWISPHNRFRHFVRSRWTKRGNRWVFSTGGFAARPNGLVVARYTHPQRRVTHRQHRQGRSVVKHRRTGRNRGIYTHERSSRRVGTRNQTRGTKVAVRHDRARGTKVAVRHDRARSTKAASKARHHRKDRNDRGDRNRKRNRR